MTNLSPKVAVIVPVYNVEKFLSRCLDSILSQSFRDFECILVDDGSLDSSSDICDEYAKKDKRIRVIHKSKNEGLPQARRAGFDLSKAEYIQFVDSDDWIENNFLEKMYSKMQEEDFDLVCCDFYNDKGKAYSYEVQSFDFDDNFNNLGFVHCCSVWNKLFKRSILSKVQFPIHNKYEDRVITQQYLFHSKKIGRVPYPLYHYVYNPNSISHGQESKRINFEWTENILEVIRFLKINLSQEEFKRKEKNIREYIEAYRSNLVAQGRGEEFSKALANYFDTIPIVYICDDNYVMPTCVSIVSLYKNKLHSTKYAVSVLAVDVSDFHLEKLHELSSNFLDVEIISTSLQGNFLQYSTDSHVSTVALQKFELANRFFDLNKIIYLDCDTIVEGDLTELYETNIMDYYAGVVKDIKAMVTISGDRLQRLQLDHRAYFNSGVMLLNLKLMRQNKLSSSLFKYKQENTGGFMDQDALNACFEDNVLFLHPKFNFMTWGFFHISNEVFFKFYAVTDFSKIDDLLKNSSIIHLTSQWKPWIYDIPVYSELFYRYYSQSPYKGIALSLLPNPLRRIQLKKSILRILRYLLPYGVRHYLYPESGLQVSLFNTIKRTSKGLLLFMLPGIVIFLLSKVLSVANKNYEKVSSYFSD